MTDRDDVPLVYQADGGDGHGFCLVCHAEQDGYPCQHTAEEFAAALRRECSSQGEKEEWVRCPCGSLGLIPAGDTTCPDCARHGVVA